MVGRDGWAGGYGLVDERGEARRMKGRRKGKRGEMVLIYGVVIGDDGSFKMQGAAECQGVSVVGDEDLWIVDAGLLLVVNW